MCVCLLVGAATHPIGRVGAPHDIAEMAAFLADPEKAGLCAAPRSPRQLLFPCLPLLLCRLYYGQHCAGGRRAPVDSCDGTATVRSLRLI
jgi:hypothetical protein